MHRRGFLIGAATLALGACSGGSGGSSGGASEPSPVQVLAAAHDKLVAAKGLTLALTSTGVPPKVNGVTAAAGKGVVDATTPKFSGTVTGTVKGVSGTLTLIAIGDKAWMKFFTPDFTPADLKALGAPNPAALLNATSGIPSLLTATDKPTKGAEQRRGSEIVQTYSGTLPGAPVRTLLGLDPADSGFRVSYGVTSGGELRAVDITGAFYAGAQSTYTLVLTDYGASVDITAP